MGTKLSIVYLVPSPEISGGTYVACEHASRLARRGHRVSLAVAEGEPRVGWFPGLAVPVTGLGGIDPGTDVVVATWWETAYLAARVPARARCYLVQAYEPLFYDDAHRTERLFASLTYRLGYPMLTVAPWLARRLEAESGSGAVVVRNQLNPDLFGPAPPDGGDAPQGLGTDSFVSFSVRAERECEGQVYWDSGSGFNDGERASFAMGPERGARHVAVPDPAGLGRLRIDAGNLPGNAVEFSAVSLSSGGAALDLSAPGRWRPNRDAADFSAAGGALRVRASGDDPYLVCALGTWRRGPSPGTRRFRVLVEGPLGIEFKGARKALELARESGAEVWFVEGKGRGSVFEGARPDKVFNRVPIDRMREIYSACDVLLKLSRVESFAYPPLEMMACGGIPVVGDVEGIREYMEDGVNGLIVPPGDDAGTVRALRRLMDDEGLRARLREGCAATARRESDWEGQIDVLERFLAERVAAAGKPPVEVRARAEEIVGCWLELMERRAAGAREDAPPGPPAAPPGLLARVRSRLRGES